MLGTRTNAQFQEFRDAGEIIRLVSRVWKANVPSYTAAMYPRLSTFNFRQGTPGINILVDVPRTLLQHAVLATHDIWELCHDGIRKTAVTINFRLETSTIVILEIFFRY